MVVFPKSFPENIATCFITFLLVLYHPFSVSI